MIIYKGKAIYRIPISGYYQFYSDKQQRFLTFDSLQEIKSAIDEDQA